MSMILGIYSKKEVINFDLIKPLIDDFRKNRDIDIVTGKRFVIAGRKKLHLSSNIFESSEKGFIVGVGGEILDFQSDALRLQKKGFEFKNIADSSEFVINSFLSSGEKFLKDLKGAFALGIYDYKKDELFIANDHFGTYPLFVYSDEDYFIFSNEYEPILKYPKFNFKLDEEALAEYFILGAPLGGKTFFSSIKNLKPATIVRVNGHSISENTYDVKKISVEKNKKLKDFAADFASAFKQSVNIRTENTENRNCALTGGIDTRLVLSAMPDKIRKETRFISLLTEPLKEEEDRDVLIAKMISSRLGLNHVVEPMNDWTNVWTKDFDVSFFEDSRFRNNEYIISGHYGSELIKGEFLSLIPNIVRKQIEYNNESFFKRIKNKFDLSRTNGREANNSTADITFPKILSDAYKKYIPDVYSNLDKEIKSMQAENKELEFAIYYMTRSFFSNMYGGSYGSWLTTYKFPTEWCLPFLDKNILNLLLSMPLEFIIRKDQKFYNHIYKDHFTELINIPTSSYFGEIKGNCIAEYKKAKEPKIEKLPKYEKAFKDLLSEPLTEDLNLFDFNKIKMYKNQGNNPDIRAFIEFETWLKYSKKLF